MLDNCRTAWPGFQPAANGFLRHQVSFKWTDIDSFLKKAAPSSCAFIKQMSVPMLVSDDKSRTVVAADVTGSKLYGTAGMVLINDQAGYLCFCESDRQMSGYDVIVAVNDNDENCLEICSRTLAKVAHFQGDFRTLHLKQDERCLEAHMFEALISKAFGIFDFDLSRNVTYDIPDDSGRIPLFRDQLGFILTDSRQFILFSQRFKVQKQESDWDIRILDFNDESAVSELGTFDQEVVGEDRLRQLHAGSKSVNGYVLFTRDKIMCLYAKSQSIMEAMLSTTISQLDDKTRTITLFSIYNDGMHAWLQNTIPHQFSEGTVYRRLHTRCIPKQIRWDYVYAASIGWQIA
ncbi:hypothetical protein TTRE_0000382601 [Trichuris trichiura]|uniref:DUF7596 domain-containing protein n=1 Tax=Trichuris trichiura TaxID=36087 RepID=A0A077Z7C8_TRITR|nr:hypothetical protein TTRE_0000382601 [Trichuris trichiura]